MTILKITFLWEDDGNEYDEFMQQLIMSGAWDIEDEEVKPTEEPSRTRKKQKK